MAMDTGGSVTSEQVLGKRLQQARRQAGLTQQQLCAQANLTYSTLAKIERGAMKSASIFTVQSIATALHTGIDALLGSENAPSIPAPDSKRSSQSGIPFVYLN